MQTLKTHLTTTILALMLLALGAGMAVAQTPNTADGFFQMYQSKNDDTWSGSDQGTTFRASNGHIYWIHADTILGTESSSGAYAGGWRMIGNTILREDNGALVRATTTELAVPDPATGERIWLQGMFEANGFAYGLAQRIRGGSNFELPGNDLAKFRIEANGNLTFLNRVSTPLSNENGSALRASVVSGGMVYIYGSGGSGSAGGSWVLRAPVGSIENTSQWQFWKGGSNWSAGIAGRAKVRDGYIESVHVLNGKWVILFKFYGEQYAHSGVGSAPTGPWTEANAFSAPFYTPSNGYQVVNYCPQLHPEYTLSSGKFLASIAYNSDLFNAVAKDADLYKLRFFEVTIPGLRNPVNETESLSVVAQSSDTHERLAYAPLSNRWGTVLQANAPGDFVTHSLPGVSAGSYNVRVGVKKFPARGQFQMSAAPAGGNFSNVGSVQDQYAPTEQAGELNLGTWTPSASGDKWFKFTVAGKLSSSTGYALSFDYIKLTPQ